MANLTTLSVSSQVITSTGTFSTLDNSFGTAGTSNANVISVQGISGGVAQSITGPVTISGTATIAGTVTATVSNPISSVNISISGSGITASSLNTFNTGGNVNVSISGSGVTASSLNTFNTGGLVYVSVSGSGVTGSSINTNITNASLPVTVSGVTVSSAALQVYGSLSVAGVSTVSVTISGSGVTASSLNTFNTGGTVSLSGVTVSGSALQVYGTLSASSTVTASTQLFNGVSTFVGITASSAAPTAAQPALVVAMSPNSINPNGSAVSASSAPIVVASDQATIATTFDVTQLAVGKSGSSLTASTATVSVPTATTQTIIAAVGSKQIHVLAAYMINGSTSNNVLWRSHSTTSNTDATWNFASNGGMVLPFNPVGWFATTTGEALDIVTTASGPFNGRIVYGAW